jgi:hypothetical protein
MANPNIPIKAVFEAGLTIMIPVLLQSAVTTTNLPPWKATS